MTSLRKHLLTAISMIVVTVGLFGSLLDAARDRDDAEPDEVGSDGQHALLEARRLLALGDAQGELQEPAGSATSARVRPTSPRVTATSRLRRSWRTAATRSGSTRR